MEKNNSQPHENILNNLKNDEINHKNKDKNNQNNKINSAFFNRSYDAISNSNSNSNHNYNYNKSNKFSKTCYEKSH